MARPQVKWKLEGVGPLLNAPSLGKGHCESVERGGLLLEVMARKL